MAFNSLFIIETVHFVNKIIDKSTHMWDINMTCFGSESTAVKSIVHKHIEILLCYVNAFRIAEPLWWKSTVHDGFSDKGIVMANLKYMDPNIIARSYASIQIWPSLCL